MISKVVVIFVQIYAVLAYIPAEHEHLSEGYDLPTHTFATSHRPIEESSHDHKSAASSSQYTAAAETAHKQSSVYVARGHSTYFKPENTVSQSVYHSDDLHYGNIPTQHTIANIPKYDHHQYDHKTATDYSSNKGNPIKYQSPSSSISSDHILTDKHYLGRDYYVRPSVDHHLHEYHHTDPSTSTYSKYADVTQSSHHKNVVSYSPASEVSRTSFHGTNYQYAY